MRHHASKLEDAFLTRRDFLCRCGMGLGALGFMNLLSDAAGSQEGINPLSPRSPQFPGRAKRVIHFFLNGGASHVDTFDPKPMLTKYDGKPLPVESLRTERKTGAAFGSPFTFRKYGQSGLEISDLFPCLATHADDVCVIRSSFWNQGAGAVECAGFFNPDFGADQADIVWREGASAAGVKEP